MSSNYSQPGTIVFATVKPRLFQRALTSIHGSSIYRSKELDTAASMFDAYETNLNTFIATLQEHHKAIFKMKEMRMKMANSLGQLIQGSPIDYLLGNPQDHRIPLHVSDANNNSRLQPSYINVQHKICSQQKLYLDVIDEIIIKFVKKLRKVEIDRVKLTLKQSELLLREVDHYQNKLERLEMGFSRVERIRRNQLKFISAKRIYEDFVQDACLLIEEVVVRGWRDLYQVVLHLLNNDLHFTTFEYKTVFDFHDIIKTLIAIGAKFQVKESRIQEIMLSSAIDLCTIEKEHKGLLEMSINVESSTTSEYIFSEDSPRQDPWEFSIDCIGDSFNEENEKKPQSYPVDFSLAVHDIEYRISDKKSTNNSNGGVSSSRIGQESDTILKKDENYYADDEFIYSSTVDGSCEGDSKIICKEGIENSSEAHFSIKESGVKVEETSYGSEIPQVTDESDFMDVDVILAPAPLCD